MHFWPLYLWRSLLGRYRATTLWFITPNTSESLILANIKPTVHGYCHSCKVPWTDQNLSVNAIQLGDNPWRDDRQWERMVLYVVAVQEKPHLEHIN